MKAFCQIYAQWDQVGSRIGEEARHLLDLGLVCDAAFSFAHVERQLPALHKIAEAGGLCAPAIYPQNLDRTLTNPNWWKYTPAECLRLLDLARGKYDTLGLGPLRAINTYTPGNPLVTACRQSGVRYILGFCAPTVIEDGDWEIAHYGSPLSPFFASDEDFRKPEAGDREDAVLISSMELRNPMVCLNHWSEGPWCPLNAQAADRWLEPSADPLPFIQIAEDWLRQSEMTGRPLFFHLNLQYFFAGRCYEHNRRALEWLALQRDRGRLEIGGLQEWARRLRAGGGFRPQTSYWSSEMMGFHVGHRPGCFADVIVQENLGGQKVWQHPDPLPRRHYDYGRRWDYPAFQPDGSAPASSSFEGVVANIRTTGAADLKREFEIEIRNDGPARKIPLALWQAFESWEGPYRASVEGGEWAAELAPHPSGSGGALLLEGEAATGVTLLKVVATGTANSSHLLAKDWGRLVAARTFFKNGRPYTILAAQTPEAFVLNAQIARSPKEEEPVVVESLIGHRYTRQTLVGEHAALKFDGTRLSCWHRLWGVSADQVRLSGVEAVEDGLRKATSRLVDELAPWLKVSAPCYQLFGNIRDRSRWDRKLARAAGEREMRRVNDWFAGQRPCVGEVVIEVHPGIFIPRGSITKVLGHEFDVVRCAEGYGFTELCVDYPQSWDWGVAAWVQWRHLKMRVAGLKPGRGNYLLHLHAFDIEARDISQRIHFFNPEAEARAPKFDPATVHQNAEICGVAEWALPRGAAGREHPSSLCSVLIPEVCLSWPAIGIWVVPLERTRLYDWVSEQGAPGLLSHLWVTRQP